MAMHATYVNTRFSLVHYITSHGVTARCAADMLVALAVCELAHRQLLRNTTQGLASKHTTITTTTAPDFTTQEQHCVQHDLTPAARLNSLEYAPFKAQTGRYQRGMLSQRLVIYEHQKYYIHTALEDLQCTTSSNKQSVVAERSCYWHCDCRGVQYAYDCVLVLNRLPCAASKNVLNTVLTVSVVLQKERTVAVLHQCVSYTALRASGAGRSSALGLDRAHVTHVLDDDLVLLASSQQQRAH
eukprot:2214-Heterococcus_DN1.PRE.5